MTMRCYLYSGPMQSIAIRASDGTIADTDFVPGRIVELDPEHGVTVVLQDAGYLGEPEQTKPDPAATGTALAVLPAPFHVAQE